MERETGDQERCESPLEANMRSPVICKRIDTSHWVLLLPLKQSFVSLFTTPQKVVWMQLFSDPREIHKIAKVTRFLLIFLLIQAEANISVKCLSAFCQRKTILLDML